MSQPTGAEAAQLTAIWTEAAIVDGFSIERTFSPAGAYSAIATMPEGATSFTDADVTAGTTYCYRVRAFTIAGYSDYSNVACATAVDRYALVVLNADAGTGTVTSTPAGISCGGSCWVTYPSGTSIISTATAATGSTFNGWSGGGCSDTGACTFALTAPTTVIASFLQAPPAALTLAYNGNVRDRVGQGATALAADGTLDGTLTATFSVPGGRTVTGLELRSAGGSGGIWDTDDTTPYWALGVSSSLDGALLNNPATKGISVPVADGASLVLFASDYAGNPFQSGAALTLKATFSDGSTATANTTVASTTVPSASAAVTLAYNGNVRDRVGQGATAFAADGALDGTLTATLSAPGGRTVTGLELRSAGGSGGIWDTDGTTPYWVLGVSSSLDGSLLNNPATKGISVPVADGASLVLFASDYFGNPFQPGAALTLKATFSDGSTATANTTVGSTTVPSASAVLTLAYNGKLRDRVGQAPTAFVADGALDGTLTATLSASGGRTVTGLELRSAGGSGGIWDTDGTTAYWVLGVSGSLDRALLNNPATKGISVPVADGASLVLFASDYAGNPFQAGAALTLKATFSDGSVSTAVTLVP